MGIVFTIVKEKKCNAEAKKYSIDKRVFEELL